jgi:lipoate-protein ligase B
LLGVSVPTRCSSDLTEWITACGLEGAAFTTMARELGRSVSVDEVRAPAAAAVAEVFALELEERPAPATLAAR